MGAHFMTMAEEVPRVVFVAVSFTVVVVRMSVALKCRLATSATSKNRNGFAVAHRDKVPFTLRLLVFDVNNRKDSPMSEEERKDLLAQMNAELEKTKADPCTND